MFKGAYRQLVQQYAKDLKGNKLEYILIYFLIII